MFFLPKAPLPSNLTKLHSMYTVYRIFLTYNATFRTFNVS